MLRIAEISILCSGLVLSIHKLKYATECFKINTYEEHIDTKVMPVNAIYKTIGDSTVYIV